MTALPLRALVAALALATGIVTPATLPRQGPAAAESPCDIRTTARVVVIADVHGAYDRFVRILQKANLIDADLHWSGGKAVFVQLGDVLDRGADSRKALDLLRRLETEAPQSGGRVEAILGNHEVMRMTGDYRYVSAGEYAAFETPSSKAQRDRFYLLAAENEKRQAAAAGKKFDDKAFQKQFYDQTPLGLVEMAAAFGPTGAYGPWLRGHSVMARVNGIAFVHGGFTRPVAAKGCEAINAQAHTELQTFPGRTPAQREQSLIEGETGPLWYRGLVFDRLQEMLTANPAASADDMLKESDVDAIMTSLSVRAIVVGHTVAQDAKVHWRFNRRVFQLDSGMLDGDWFPGGAATALEIAGDTFSVIYENRRETIDPPRPPADGAAVQH